MDSSLVVEYRRSIPQNQASGNLVTTLSNWFYDKNEKVAKMKKLDVKGQAAKFTSGFFILQKISKVKILVKKERPLDYSGLPCFESLAA
jgi:hypothetical protein